MVRVAELRAQNHSAEYRMANAQAAQMRDSLLLIGVRAELAPDGDNSWLVVHVEDVVATEERITQAGIEIQKK